jgi:hypothetical protein
MSNVISMTAWKNDRRAAAEIERREDARFDRYVAERQSIADSLGGTEGAQIIADVVMNLQMQDKAASAPKYTPAYSDPANEQRGSKYDATRDLRNPEIAKRIRADIKALGLNGVKVSVTTKSYSGGGSIDVKITALPHDFKVMSEKAASWRKQFGDNRDGPFHWADGRSTELSELLAKLTAIHGSYNRDNSDTMVDYFDVRYYGSVDLDWQLRREHEAREIAANAGTYWAENS